MSNIETAGQFLHYLGEKVTLNTYSAFPVRSNSMENKLNGIFFLVTVISLSARV